MRKATIFYRVSWSSFVNDQRDFKQTSPINIPDVWADALNASIDHNLWSIEGSEEAAHAWNYPVQRALIMVTHLENQILAKAAIPV